MMRVERARRTSYDRNSSNGDGGGLRAYTVVSSFCNLIQDKAAKPNVRIPAAACSNLYFTRAHMPQGDGSDHHVRRRRVHFRLTLAPGLDGDVVTHIKVLASPPHPLSCSA